MSGTSQLVKRLGLKKDRPGAPIVSEKTAFSTASGGNFVGKSKTSLWYADENIALGHEDRDYNYTKENTLSRIWVDPTVDFGETPEIARIAARRNALVNVTGVALAIAPIGASILGAVFASWWYLLLTIPAVAVILLLVGVLGGSIMNPVLPTQNSLSHRNDVMDRGVGTSLRNLLYTHESPHLITTLIRNKYIDLGDDPSKAEFFNWVDTVIKIFTIEPNYNPDNVPLMNDDAMIVLGAIRSKDRVRAEKVERARADAAKISEETADYRRQINVDQSRAASARTLAIALELIDKETDLESFPDGPPDELSRDV